MSLVMALAQIQVRVNVEHSLFSLSLIVFMCFPLFVFIKLTFKGYEK